MRANIPHSRRRSVQFVSESARCCARLLHPREHHANRRSARRATLSRVRGPGGSVERRSAVGELPSIGLVSLADRAAKELGSALSRPPRCSPVPWPSKNYRSGPLAGRSSVVLPPTCPMEVPVAQWAGRRLAWRLLDGDRPRRLLVRNAGGRIDAFASAPGRVHQDRAGIRIVRNAGRAAERRAHAWDDVET